jgi:outer membrane lipoprotein-sorting protein
MRLPLAVVTVVLVLAVTLTGAAPPDVMTVVKQMKEVLEPTGSRMQKVVISTTTPTGEKTQWVAGQARKQFADGKRTLLVMLEPADVRGNTLLISERQGQPDVMWWYATALRRVRALVPVEAYQRFLDTDFTYADLEFVPLQGTYSLLGEEEHAGVRAYKVEIVPQEPWYYSRIITWVAADSMLPLQRDFYDQAGRLWRSEFFEEITVIDGVPTPLQIRMQDVQQGTSTELKVSEVRTDVALPDEFFDPKQLPQVEDARLWQGYGSQVAAGK